MGNEGVDWLRSGVGFDIFTVVIEAGLFGSKYELMGDMKRRVFICRQSD
jgi:hypothetical protein